MTESKTADAKSAAKAKPKTENLSSAQVLKELNINKEDLEKLCDICQLGQPKDFTPQQMETLSEVIQRRLDGANSFAEAYAQMQAEVTPVEAEPVDDQVVESDVLDNAEESAIRDAQLLKQMGNHNTRATAQAWQLTYDAKFAEIMESDQVAVFLQEDDLEALLGKPKILELADRRVQQIRSRTAKALPASKKS